MPLLVFIIAYLAGSINFSILVCKLTQKGDPRNSFSGNPGMTNVYRQSGLVTAAVVLLLDMGRSVAVAVLAAGLLSYNWVPWIGFGLIVGNRYPCFHDFRGGKGVANYLGFTLYTSPYAVLWSALAWLLCFACFRIPFIGSFAMVVILAGATIDHCGYHFWCSTGSILTILFIVYGHRQNMKELINGRKPGAGDRGS
jgi:glycerol-3-phosphate acyltransferase PlsY